MNGEQFLTDLQAYYGTKYGPFDRMVVGPWLSKFERIGGRFDDLFDAVTATVSKSYGKLPDKAQLIDAVKELRKRVDPNALPPPPAYEPPNLTPAEQAEMDRLSDLTTLIPSYRPSGRDFTPDRTSKPGAATMGDILVAKRAEA